MKYTETRILLADSLRALCIRKSWYTSGTNEQYCRLFARLHNEDGTPANMTTDKLAEVAEDIMEHSRITDYGVADIMFELARSCSSIFEEA